MNGDEVAVLLGIEEFVKRVASEGCRWKDDEHEECDIFDDNPLCHPCRAKRWLILLGQARRGEGLVLVEDDK